METLLDRIQIEDFLTRYYYDLSVGHAKELSEYFTENALLDVDGVVADVDVRHQGGAPDRQLPFNHQAISDPGGVLRVVAEPTQIGTDAMRQEQIALERDPKVELAEDRSFRVLLALVTEAFPGEGATARHEGMHAP